MTPPPGGGLLVPDAPLIDCWRRASRRVCKIT